MTKTIATDVFVMSHKHQQNTKGVLSNHCVSDNSLKPRKTCKNSIHINIKPKVSYLESSFDFEFSSYVIWHTFLDLPLLLSSTCSVSLHFCKNNLHTTLIFNLFENHLCDVKIQFLQLANCVIFAIFNEEQIMFYDRLQVVSKVPKDNRKKLSAELCGFF